MGVTRIVPYLESNDFEATKDFYVGVLGLTAAMEDPDGGDFLGLASPANPSAQIVPGTRRRAAASPLWHRRRRHRGPSTRLTPRSLRRGLEVVHLADQRAVGHPPVLVDELHGTIISVLAHIKD